MRRPILNLTVLVLVLTLSVSFIAVLPASSQDTGKIIDKLGELRGKVENEHTSLENKVNAVIHQIEAGAFNGALNKLENDVKKSIIAWVDNPDELIKLVDEIIDLIRGITPPTPGFTVTATPETLEIAPGQTGTSTITVTSLYDFNMPVDLTAELTPGTDVTFEFDPLQVTPSPEGENSTLTVQVAVSAEPGEYEITVTGTSGTLEESVEIDLTITGEFKDKTPPEIVTVQRTPEQPTYTHSVTVQALVTDTQSGVDSVLLSYSGSSWTNVTMTLTEGLYNATIPAFPYNTSVEYRVYASDKAGNWAMSILYSYIPTDPYGPLLSIDKPDQGSYLRGLVKVKVFAQDDYFENATLLINSIPRVTWTTSGEQTYDWDTTKGEDGLYNVKLTVLDKAGNTALKELTVTVDNTLPSATIDEPTEGSYLRLSVLIKVTGSDTNFDMMEVKIDGKRVKTWTSAGIEVHEWDTRKHSEGSHSVELIVFDKAGNSRQASAMVTVDNLAPLIGAATWSPRDPGSNEKITINVTVSEPAYGSGVKNVTLRFMNKTLDEWQNISMTFQDGNWTVTLENQSDTLVRFSIEAYDKAGNKAKGLERKFTVAAPASVPLAWILIAIAVAGAGTGGGVYYWRRRRKKPSGTLVASMPPLA